MKREKKTPWFIVEVENRKVRFTIVGANSFQTFTLHTLGGRRWHAKMLRHALLVLQGKRP